MYFHIERLLFYNRDICFYDHLEKFPLKFKDKLIFICLKTNLFTANIIRFRKTSSSLPVK